MPNTSITFVYSEFELEVEPFFTNHSSVYSENWSELYESDKHSQGSARAFAKVHAKFWDASLSEEFTIAWMYEKRSVHNMVLVQHHVGTTGEGICV